MRLVNAVDILNSQITSIHSDSTVCGNENEITRNNIDNLNLEIECRDDRIEQLGDRFNELADAIIVCR
jgi:hypothetical protein